MATVDLSARETAIALLAAGMTSNDVGTAVGVSGRTVRRWREDPTFREQVEAGRREILHETVAALTSAVRKAVTTLETALTDPAATIRVKAAGDLLRSLPALADHANVEARLAD
ncbi:hypothetical protein FKN01_32230, partial [Streptomyces sp. 130]|uniref:helix-turn-helix domain-containing protein n=1 Tax=Streptomyces sp. 130 TaxID=2591006 RepID=UPI00117EA74A